MQLSKRLFAHSHLLTRHLIKGTVLQFSDIYLNRRPGQISLLPGSPLNAHNADRQAVRNTQPDGTPERLPAETRSGPPQITV